MIRTQISLEESDMERLRSLARKQGVSIASLLRDSVEQLLRQHQERGDIERAIAASGKFRSGTGHNVSVDHDSAFVDSMGS